jgi:hypothetical protein
MKIPLTIHDLRFTPRIRRLKTGVPPVTNDRSAFQTLGPLFSLSQRERAGVRENCSDRNGEGELNSKPCPRALAPLRWKNSRKSERGIALVITLILLSVTLVMAVAFLAISRRERNSVSTETDTTTAKLAADSALAQAEAQLASGMLATTNPYVFSLLVSTNYINGYGFVTGLLNPTNVNYNNYINNGGPLTLQDPQFNVANLQYLPRPPVYATNYTFATEELQFYLDLNRNGRYDTNGWVTNIDNETPANGFGTNWEVGDPEWIGVLEHPDAPHSANNPFIARYAFIAVPANSLDLNTIHNQALQAGFGGAVPSVSGRDLYSRNQGVGPWEINLAAFLTDLNTNRWDPGLGNFFGLPVEPYTYPEGLEGNSAAFDDARSLVAWRYGYLYPSLASANGIFGDPVGFENNDGDEYALGLQTTFDTNYAGYGSRTLPWLGADNTNNFFSSPSDLFNPAKSFNPVTSSSQFTNNLTLAGTYNSTYDRYTFYRMLGQLGTDTSPESGKINLNYSNAAVNYDASGLPLSVGITPGAETNLVPWVPLDFFTAAADKLLHTYTTAWYESSPSNFMQTYYGLTATWYTNIDGFRATNSSAINQIPAFGITNIPVYLNGRFVYSPAVNRLLQLAANFYDSSTNNMNFSLGLSNYPSIFRPVFWVTNEINPLSGLRFANVYIKGYQYVPQPLPNNFNATPIFTPPIEVSDPRLVNSLSGGISTSNVWGVPWIIGAKKGFPNFNAFEMENCFLIQRELQFSRSTVAAAGRTYTTNQMYIMSISNYLGVEDWNSYAASYNNPVTIVANDQVSVALTNTAGGVQPVFPFNQYPLPMIFSRSTNMITWSGYLKKAAGDPSFVLPLATNTTWLTNSVYYYGTGPNNLGYPANSFIPTSLDSSNYYDVGTPPLPQFNLLITNRLQAYIIDTRLGNSYLLDYVQLGGMDNNLNVNQAIADGDNQGMWSTNFFNGGGSTPFGVNEQYLVSQGTPLPAADIDAGSQGWSNTQVPGTGGLVDKSAQVAFFQAFFSPSDTAVDSENGTLVSNYDSSVQAPYTPIRLAVQRFVFDANDPLVHYLTSDLIDPSSSTNGQRQIDNPPLSRLGILSGRYMPWGNTINQLPATYNYFNSATPTDYQNPFNLSYKDPLVIYSDNWDFPTNKYPTVGWLGRVHRGTPWQSVYMKSSNLLARTSFNPSGGPGAPIGAATWEAWTADPNAFDANNSAPVQDRLLFDLFTAAPDSLSTRGRVNVNIGADDPLNPQAGLASWSALLSGAIVFSNSQPDGVISTLTDYQNPLPNAVPRQNGPAYLLWTNQPAGLDIANSTLGQIVQSINSARTNYVGLDGLQGVFEHAGDVLAASKLSDGSPFLASDAAQQQHAISDEMYEWLPQQMMSLVTVSGTPQSPPRYVVYCYGQTLKPAPDGMVTSGQFFGLCTNYQVTAESASRAIIRIENTPTPANPNATPHIVVEQYNPLPPD